MVERSRYRVYVMAYDRPLSDAKLDPGKRDPGPSYPIDVFGTYLHEIGPIRSWLERM